jgi:hypothetical protein
MSVYVCGVCIYVCMCVCIRVYAIGLYMNIHVHMYGMYACIYVCVSACAMCLSLHKLYMCMPLEGSEATTSGDMA